MTLAECCFETGGIGADVDVAGARRRTAASTVLAATLFGESASRVIVSVAPASVGDGAGGGVARGVPARAHRPHRRTRDPDRRRRRRRRSTVGVSEAEARWSAVWQTGWTDRRRERDGD